MAIVKMKKLSVIGMQEERESILRELMNLGVVEISNPQNKLQDDDWQTLVVRDGDEANFTEKDKQIYAVQESISIIENFASIKKPIFPIRKNITESEFNDLCKDEHKFKIESEEILSLREDYNQAQSRENAANAQIFALSPWQAYQIPLEKTTTEQMNILLGVFSPNADIEALAGEIEADGCPCILREVNRDKEQIYSSLIYFRNDEKKVLEKIKTYGWSKPAFSFSSGTVSENIERCKKEIEVLSQNKEEIRQKIVERAGYLEDLQIYHDMLIVARDKSKIRSNLVNTEKVFEFDGYLPSVYVNTVKEILKNYFCSYEFREPEEGDDVPVRLKNKSFFSPIEFVTSMYSLPSYREIDPTSIFSLFYILFFGIMFGDVGYGIMLVLGSIIAIKKFKMNEGSAAKLMRVIFYSGISSIIWGIMFGSFFGDLIPVVGKTFFDKTINIKPLWLDPAKEPMIFLMFSCALGVVHLFVGMGIKAYQEIKDGKFLDACNDVFIWYMIVLGLIMWIFGESLSTTAVTIGKWMAIAGFALAIILPIFIAVGSGKALGIWNIYSGVTGNLSDILSYSRLLGLGLASTSIAGVFNFLASMGGKSVVGVIMFILIFLVGHALNFAINALGAFVHSCRLQYVEFFGKFYEGGGREFDPFNRNTKYINIIEGGN